MKLTLKIGLSLLALASIVAGLFISIEFLLTFDWEFFGNNTMEIVSMLLILAGVLLLFVLYSKNIDEFFVKTDNKKINLFGSKISVSSIIWFIVSIGLLVLTVMLLMGVFVVEVDLLGKYTGTILKFGLVIITLSSFVFSFNDIIKPALTEIKKISWPNSKEMVDYSKRVFSFIIYFALFFLLADLFYNWAAFWIK